MNFSRRFRSTRPASTNNQALACLKKIQDCVPYLEKRKEILRTDNNCFHNEDLNQINYWLGIAKDVEADLTYEMQTLEAIYDQITEMAREFPVEWDDDDDESEAEEEDEEEILGLAEQMNRPAAPPLSPPVGGILIPGGRGRGVHGRTNNSALTQTPPETQPGSSPPTFIRIPNGYSVGRGRGKRLEANENPPQPGPNSSNGHDNNSTNYLPRHIEHQRSESQTMQFQSRTSPQESSSRSENLVRSPTGAPVSQVEYGRVIDYGHQMPANSPEFDVYSQDNNVDFNENGAPGSRFSVGCDTMNSSTNFGASGSNVAQDAVSPNPSQQFHQNRAQVYAPNNHPGSSHQFQQNNLQNYQFNHPIRPPRPLSIPRSSLLGNSGPSVFSNPRIPHFQNIQTPQMPLPTHTPRPPLLLHFPPLIGHMPSSSTWIPNRHQNFNPNHQRGFGPRKPSHLIRPHFNPNARGGLQPQTRIQARFDSISRTDISTNQTQCPPGGNLASSSASKPPDTNSIDWRSRVNDYFSQQQQRPTNGIRLTNPHQARHRGRGRGNSRGGPAARGRRPPPPSQAKNLLNNSNNKEPQRNEEDSKETETSTSPPSAKKRQATVQTAEDREKNRVLNRVRANLERELPQRSKESKLAQMRKEFSQNEVYRLGFKNKDNTIQKGPVEKLPEPHDEDSPTKNVSRSRSRSVPRARSRSKSAAKDSRDQSGSLSPKKKPSRRVDDDDVEDAENQDEENDRDEQISYEDQEDDTERQGGNSDAENDSQDMTENEQSKVPQVSDESHFIALARSLLVETGVSEEDIENVLSNPNQKKEILNAIQEALARPNQNVSQSQQELEVNNVTTQPPPRPESTSSSAASTISESSTSDGNNSSTKKRKKADQSRTNDITEDSSAPSPPPKSPPPKKRSQSSAPTKTAKNTTKGRSGRQEIHFIKAPELPIHVGMTKIKIEQDYVAEQRIKQEPVHPDQNCDDSD